MATTVTATGKWTVDINDELTQDFDLTENGGPVDNWATVVVEVDIPGPGGTRRLLRSDGVSPQVVLQAAAPATIVSVTLVADDTAVALSGAYRIVVIDSVENERTTHASGVFKVQGSYT